MHEINVEVVISAMRMLTPIARLLLGHSILLLVTDTRLYVLRLCNLQASASVPTEPAGFLNTVRTVRYPVWSLS